MYTFTSLTPLGRIIYRKASLPRNCKKFSFSSIQRQEQIPLQETRYEFGNILFGGPCNQKCPFCIGKQLPKWLTPTNLKTVPSNIKNFGKFVKLMNESGTKKIILTGTRTDPQLYKYEGDLLEILRLEIPGCHISLHTNGLLAQKKIDLLNKYDTCTVSVNTFDPAKFKSLHGVKTMPNIKFLMQYSQIPIKLSCVLTSENIPDLDQYIDRCIEMGVKRVSFRHLFGDGEQFAAENQTITLFKDLDPTRYFRGNPVYHIDNLEITHWTFEDFSKPSINLFSDGTISRKSEISSHRL
eukprot:jgi/Bigna1/90457/estExt_fgenesh1_pg.C_710022